MIFIAMANITHIYFKLQTIDVFILPLTYRLHNFIIHKYNLIRDANGCKFLKEKI